MKNRLARSLRASSIEPDTSIRQNITALRWAPAPDAAAKAQVDRVEVGNALEPGTQRLDLLFELVDLAFLHTRRCDRGDA